MTPRLDTSPCPVHYTTMSAPPDLTSQILDRMHAILHQLVIMLNHRLPQLRLNVHLELIREGWDKPVVSILPLETGAKVLEVTAKLQTFQATPCLG